MRATIHCILYRSRCNSRLCWSKLLGESHTMCGNGWTHCPAWFGNNSFSHTKYCTILACTYMHVHVYVYTQLGGAVTEKPLNMGVLLKKRVSLICSTLRARSLEYKHRLIQEVITVLISPLWHRYRHNYYTTVCSPLPSSIWWWRIIESSSAPGVSSGPSQPSTWHHEDQQEHWETYSRSFIISPLSNDHFLWTNENK